MLDLSRDRLTSQPVATDRDSGPASNVGKSIVNPELPHGRCHVQIDPLSDWPVLAEAWQELESRSRGSFFNSWSWISAWLDGVPSHVPLMVYSIWSGKLLVGLAIAGQSVIRRAGWIQSRSLQLHETGNDLYDELTVEHNAPLIDHRFEAAATDAWCERLLNPTDQWDEFLLSAIDADSRLARQLQQHARRPQAGSAGKGRPAVSYRILRERPDYQVDLEQLRQSGQEYLSQLSKGTRSQLRRSIRMYEQSYGPIEVRKPDSLPETLRQFEELAAVHTRHWQSKGWPGAFAEECWKQFHRRLIERAFARQEVQLLRITAGETLLGYLYNFAYRGTASCYQAGMVYSTDNRMRPGLVCHAAAIEWNLQRGMWTYDFLGGEHRYKSQLANRTQRLCWLKLQQPRWRFQIEDCLRKGRDWLRGWRSPVPAVGTGNSSDAAD